MATTTTTTTSTEITSPRLASLFACNRHEKFRECVAYADESYAESLEPVAIIEESTPHSRLAKLGSCTAVLYPQGDFDRLPATIDGYMAFLFLDDLIDNSTDMSYISEITSRFMSTAKGTPTDDKRFFLLSRFFTDKRWDPQNLVLAIEEAQRFMDGALALRAIEIEERIITVEEYLDIRVPNTAMGFMFRVIGFAQPELAEDLNRVMAEKPDLWDRVESPSGKSVGIALDLFKVNGLHAEVCSYTNVVKIWQRESPVAIDLGEAIKFMVSEFYRYEKEMAEALEELAEFSPGLAQAVRDVQGGTLGWMNAERGGRYSKI
nr:phomactatriene synthase [Phoma sp.]